MSRHRKIQLSKSKAILVAAGALSVATAASATTATAATAAPWTSASGQVGTARASVGRGHEVTFSARAITLAAQTPPATASPTATETASPPPTGFAPPTATSPATTPGSPRQIAEAMLGSFGWSPSQFSCLDPLWAHESGWRVSAYNASSGAYGIPQALPGSKMASAGPDWPTNAVTQIRWGLRYIKGTYGSPCAAYSHEQATGWY